MAPKQYRRTAVTGAPAPLAVLTHPPIPHHLQKMRTPPGRLNQSLSRTPPGRLQFRSLQKPQMSSKTRSLWLLISIWTNRPLSHPHRQLPRPPLNFLKC